MTFEQYQKQSRKTAQYPKKDNNFIYPTLGLVGEAGEIANKVKKIERDDNNIITDQRKQEIKKELGDVLWYIAQIATELGLSLEQIAGNNLNKLFSRQKRGTLLGDGDDR